MFGAQHLPFHVLGILLFVFGIYSVYFLIFKAETYNRIGTFAGVFWIYSLATMAFLDYLGYSHAFVQFWLIRCVIAGAVILLIGIVYSYINGPEEQKEKWRITFKGLAIILGLVILVLGLFVIHLIYS